MEELGDFRSNKLALHGFKVAIFDPVAEFIFDAAERVERGEAFQNCYGFLAYVELFSFVNAVEKVCEDD